MDESARGSAEGRVGRAGILVVESYLNAVDQLKPLRDDIVEAVRGADTLDALDARLESVVKKHEDNSDIGDALFVPMLQADMAGQLMVHGPKEADLVELTAQPTNSFLDLPWNEAIEEFKKRGLVSDEVFNEMILDYANRAEEGRELLLKHIKQITERRVVEALEQGDTFQTFAKKMGEEAVTLGIEEADPAYLKTVFRTNIQTAYGAGRYKAINDKAVVKARPYVQYRTVGDVRVRPSHALLDGKVFRADSDEWKRIAPPNGFNCRCSMVTLDEDEFTQEGGVVTDRVPDEGLPDEGFDGPPVLNVKKSLV